MEARGLTTTWQDAVGLVYILPVELCSQLDDRLDELQMGNANGASSSNAGLDNSDSDDEQNVEHQQDRATEQRTTAAATQQTLLVQLQRGQGARMQLRSVPRTNYSGMGS